MWIVGHTHTLPGMYLYHCSPSLSVPTEEPATCLSHLKDRVEGTSTSDSFSPCTSDFFFKSMYE